MSGLRRCNLILTQELLYPQRPNELQHTHNVFDMAMDVSTIYQESNLVVKVATLLVERPQRNPWDDTCPSDLCNTSSTATGPRGRVPESCTPACCHVHLV